MSFSNTTNATSSRLHTELHHLIRPSSVHDVGGSASTTVASTVLFNNPETHELPLTCSSSPIGLLPPELLLTVFQLLPSGDLLRHVPLVCRLWYQISLNPLLRKHLVLHKETPPEAALRSVQTRPLLHVLRCPALTHADHALLNILPLCSVLQCLDLGFCNLTDGVLEKLVRNLPSTLKHLNLEGMKNVGLSFIMDLATRCTVLEALNLSHCVGVCDACVHLLSQHLSRLRRLNLDGVLWLTDASLVSLVSSAAFFNGYLSEIWLDGQELTSSGVHGFVERLSTLNMSVGQLCLTEQSMFVPSRPPGVRVLWISFCDQLTGDAIQPIRKLTSLVALTLRKAQQITCLNWISLFHMLNPTDSSISTQLFSELEYLDLSEAPYVNDDVVASICQCCGPHLRSLMLNWCLDLTDRALDDIVTCCGALRHLSLVGTHLLRGTPLCDVPSNQPRLEILNLTQCNQVVDSILTNLAAQLPNLYIFDYYGERVGRADDVCHYDLWRSLEKVPICAD